MEKHWRLPKWSIPNEVVIIVVSNSMIFIIQLRNPLLAIAITIIIILNLCSAT